MTHLEFAWWFFHSLDVLLLGVPLVLTVGLCVRESRHCPDGWATYLVGCALVVVPLTVSAIAIATWWTPLDIVSVTTR